MSGTEDITSLMSHYENAPPVSPSGVRAVAALGGMLSSNLSDLDKRNIGGDSLVANTLDKGKLQQELVSIERQGKPPPQQTYVPPSVPHPQVQPVQQPVQQAPVAQPVVASNQIVVDKKEMTAIKRRLKKIEDEHKVLKSAIEFKTGYKKYHVKTDTFEGTVNNTSYLLDILLKELASKPQSITITAK